MFCRKVPSILFVTVHLSLGKPSLPKGLSCHVPGIQIQHKFPSFLRFFPRNRTNFKQIHVNESMRDNKNAGNNIPCWQTLLQALLSIISVWLWLNQEPLIVLYKESRCTELTTIAFEVVQKKRSQKSLLPLTWICYFFTTILHQVPVALMF